MMNNSISYQKTDIQISFTVENAIPAEMTYYTFKFPPNTLTSSSLCTVCISSIYIYLYIYIYLCA